MHTSGLEPSIFCILTSRLNHYATILDIRHCFLLVYVTDAAAAANTRWGYSQQRDPVHLRRRARTRRRCWPVDAINIRRPPPPPLPAPADACAAADTRRRRQQQREPVPLQRWARSRRRQQPEPAVAAFRGGEIKTQWLTLLLSRTCKRGSDQAGA